MEKSSFFNSVNGDRRYDATMWAAYFASFIGNGVFPNPSTNLQVVADQSMRLTVQPGSAWINGYFYVNTTSLSLQLDTANGTLPRIDRIVAQWSLANRAITVKVKKGTNNSSPVAPTLQRDAAIYELCLADVLVSAGATSITQAKITDRRLNTALCGVVAAVVNQIDTAAFDAQLQSWMEAFKAQSADTFAAWLDGIKDILDEDTAGYLMAITDDLSQRVDGLFDFKNRLIGFATAEQGTKADNALPATGNAASASELQTARTVSIGGKATAAGISFNGTADVALSVTDVDADKLNGQAAAYYGVAARQYAFWAPVSAWSGSEVPYTATVTVAGVPQNAIGIIGLSDAATAAQREAARNALISPATSTAANTVKLVADGDKPTIALPMVATVVG